MVRMVALVLLAGSFLAARTVRGAETAARLLRVESVSGEGVWIDPALKKAAERSSARVSVTVWFDRQFLGDGKAYRRRAKEFATWKRRDLRQAVIRTLKEVSRQSHERARKQLQSLRSHGKLDALRPHWIVNGFSANVAVDALDELARVPGVKKIFFARGRGGSARRVRGNVRSFPAATRPPFDPRRYKHPWYVRYLLADRAWSELGATGRGTLNVVHDFNFAFNDQVTPNLYRNPKEIPGNGRDDDGNGYIDDVHGYNFDAESARLALAPPGRGARAMRQLHGVLCAAIICGVGRNDVPYEQGIAPEAQWAAVIAGRRLEAAVEWAIDQGADTYSMSFSIPGLAEYRSHWRKIMEHGSFCGVYFVSGAGNFARQVPVPVQMRTPEDIPDVVFAAAGVQRDLSRTAFSSKGPVAWHTEHYRDGRVDKPEVCAFNAGLPVVLADGRVLESAANGNSFAGPMFCGTIALMLSADPDLLPWDLKEIITSTATDVGPPGVDHETGHGLINAYRAVKEVLRRRAVREGNDPSPFAGRTDNDELDIERVRRLGKKKTLVIVAVRPNSAAATLGLRNGDVITTLGGKHVATLDQFRAARRAANGKVELVVGRGGKRLTFQVAPGALGIAVATRFPEPAFK